MSLKPEDITKEEFESYRAVQKSGATNMCNIGVVMDLTGIRDRNKISHIMMNYNFLMKYHGIEED